MVSRPTPVAVMVNASVAVDRAGDEGVPVGFGVREWLARDHGFVHVGRAVGDGAVDGDAFAGAQLDPVADADLRDGDFGGFTVSYHAGGVGLQPDEAADGGAGLAAGAGLHPAAQKDEGNDDGGGLEIDGDGAGGQDGRREEREGRVAPGGKGAEGDEAVHVGRAAKERGQAEGEELPAGKGEHEGGEDELQGPERWLADQAVQPVVECRDEGARPFR